MRFAPLLPLLLACGPLLAQDDIRLFSPAPGQIDSMPPPGTSTERRGTTPQDSIAPGTVVITESDRIRALMADYAARKHPLAGYRVQIFLGDRSKAEETRRTFLVQHPDIPAYLSYLAPNFRVRVGDLRDRVEAENLRGELRGEFPGLYVVPDQIEPPRLPDAGN